MSRAFLDLLLQPVIKVVVHLLYEFIVGKFGEDDLVVGHEGNFQYFRLRRRKLRRSLKSERQVLDVQASCRFDDQDSSQTFCSSIW